MKIFSKSFFALALTAHLGLSASPIITISDLLQQNQWMVVDENNEPVSQAAIETAHREKFKAQFGLDSLPEEDHPTYTKLYEKTLTINDYISSKLGRVKTVPGGERLINRGDYTDEQRELIFKANVRCHRYALYENKFVEYFAGEFIRENSIYLVDDNTVNVGRNAIITGILKKTRMFSVDNSGKSQDEVDAWMNSEKKSQMYYDLISFSMQDNIVALTASNILATAKIKPNDYERRFLAQTMTFWDLDEEGKPFVALIVDSYDVTQGGLRIATWLLEDTFEGGNAARRVGNGIL